MELRSGKIICDLNKKYSLMWWYPFCKESCKKHLKRNCYCAHFLSLRKWLKIENINKKTFKKYLVLN